MYIILTLLVFHDFHVSRAVLDYQPSENTFQVSLHVFTDDLELALQQRGHDSLRLNSPREYAKADSLIADYLRSVIRLTNQQGAQAALKYLGKESSDDYMATWIYFYLEPPSPQGNYILYNSLLTEVYDDQQNIVNVKGTKDPFIKLLSKSDLKISLSLP